MIHTISSKYWFQAGYHYTSHNSSPLRSRVREGCEEMGIPPDVWISRDIWAWFRIDTVEDDSTLTLFYMKNIFKTLVIYIILILWIGTIFYGIGFLIMENMEGCPPYTIWKTSFLSEWLNIDYFETKNDIALDACGEFNFKPGIVYWILWILIFYSGIRLRKKYILNITQ